MPRSKTHSAETLTDLALKTFWPSGYCATTMDHLVKETGASRHSIYSDFGGKRDLFLACFDRYQVLVVTPAFGGVEKKGATLRDVAAYFEHQIALAERSGLPGPGCFVGNALTEIAPHDDEVRHRVDQHNGRLRAGFAAALRNSISREHRCDEAEIARAADMILIFATGLWAMSRVTADAGLLRNAVRNFLKSVEEQLC